MTGAIDVLATISKKLADNNLPVLRKTATQIATLATQPKCDIGEIAQTVLQDQAFTARVLKIANSVYYRGAFEKITTVTRAVIQVGYLTIRDIAIAAEFAEVAQKHLPGGIDLRHMLAKAYFAAHQGAAIGKALGIPHHEELFTSTLLQSLGELALAYYLPIVYREVEDTARSQDISFKEAHLRITGLAIHTLTDAVSRTYQLPPEIICAPPNWDPPDGWTASAKRRAVVHFASEMTANLFARSSSETTDQFDLLLSKAGSALNVPASALQPLIAEAYEKARDLGEALGLDPKCFDLHSQDGPPPPQGSRQAFIQACAHATPSLSQPPATASPENRQSPAPAPTPEPANGSSVPQFITYLTDLSMHLMATPNFNTVFSYVLEGLHRGVGFDHAVLVLVLPGKSAAVGRFAVGENASALLPEFSVQIGEETNLLAHCLAKKTSVRVIPSEQTLYSIPKNILDAIHPTWVAVGPLHAGSRAMGLIWADRTGPPSEHDDMMWNAFQLFVTQANLGLMRLAS